MPADPWDGYDARVSRAIFSAGSWAVGLSGVALALSLVATSIRVAGLEGRELDAASTWQPAGGAGPRLLEATLLRGDEVTFELCARDPMEPARWVGAGTLTVVRTDTSEEMFSLPIDAALLEGAARAGEGACVVFARVRELAIEEPEVPIAIGLVRTGDRLDAIPVRARVLARRTLGDLDLGLVLLGLATALALVVGLAARPAGDAHDSAARGALRAALGVGIVVASGIALGALAPGGPTSGLIGGLLLAGAEVGAAYALVRPSSSGSRTAALGLARSARIPSWVARIAGDPRRAERLGRALSIVSLVIAPFVGVFLFFVARIALAMVPSTGQAPVEAFVSWPSGMLSFAALAVVAPIAEEVFFRGLVYGALRGGGGAGREAVAIAGSWLLFALAHAPQDWGNWGGLLSVLVAGLGFTLLRAASGTVLVPCLAHLVYNGLLASSALAAGAG